LLSTEYAIFALYYLHPAVAVDDPSDASYVVVRGERLPHLSLRYHSVVRLGRRAIVAKIEAR
jgi:hypothetical protein